MTKFSVKKEFDNLHDYLTSFGVTDKYGTVFCISRSDVDHAMGLVGWTLVHDEPGDYDSGKDGFLVYKDPDTGELWRIDFAEDSYSNGSFEGVQKVTAKTKTVTVYE